MYAVFTLDFPNGEMGISQSTEVIEQDAGVRDAENCQTGGCIAVRGSCPTL